MNQNEFDIGRLILKHCEALGIAPDEALALIASNDVFSLTSEEDVVAFLKQYKNNESDAVDAEGSEHGVTLPEMNDKERDSYLNLRSELQKQLSLHDGEALEHLQNLFDGIEEELNCIDSKQGETFVQSLKACFSELNESAKAKSIQVIYCHIEETHGNLNVYAFEKFVKHKKPKYSEGYAQKEVFHWGRHPSLPGFDGYDVSILGEGYFEELGIDDDIRESLKDMLYIKAYSYLRACLRKAFLQDELAEVQWVRPIYVFADIGHYEEMDPGESGCLLYKID